MNENFNCVITDIKKDKKHQKAICVDGELYALIDSDIVLEKGLKIGQAMTFEQLDDICFLSDRKRAKEKAFYLLKFRDYSKKEMLSKLSEVFSEEVCEVTIQKLEELGFLNDDAFAEKYIKKLVDFKNFAPRRIYYELSLKGIEKETTENILESLDIDFYDKLKILVEKYLGKDYKDKKKLDRTIRKLNNMGYEYGDVKNAIDEIY